MKKKVVTKKDLKQKSKKKKRNKILNVFIFLLIFLAIMGIIFLITLSVEDSDSDGALIDDVFQGEIKTLDISDEDVSRLFNLFVEDTPLKVKYGEKLNNDVEARLYYSYLTLKDKNFTEIKCRDVGIVILYDEDNNYNALCSLNTTYPEEIDKMEEEIRENSTFGVEVNTLKTKYKNLFGEVKFEVKDFYYEQNQIMHYDSRADMYLMYYFDTEEKKIEIDGLFKKATLRGRTLELTITYHEMQRDKETKVYDVVYKFEKDKKTDNYIFISRTEK